MAKYLTDLSDPARSISLKSIIVQFSCLSLHFCPQSLDKHLTVSCYINKICRSASLALRNIGRVRKYLNQQSTKRLVYAFITSRLDYCNSLLYGLPAKEINKFQRLQNSAARLLTRSKIREHITPTLSKLHWLPVKQRIIFILLMTTFKIIHNYASKYLIELLESYSPRRSRFGLRSGFQNKLVVRRSSTTIKDIDSLDIFKTKVKTYLFQDAYFKL